MTNLVSEY